MNFKTYCEEIHYLNGSKDPFSCFDSSWGARVVPSKIIKPEKTNRTVLYNGWRPPMPWHSSKSPQVVASYEFEFEYLDPANRPWGYDILRRESGSGEAGVSFSFPQPSAWQLENSRMRALNKLSDEKVHLPMMLAEIGKSCNQFATFGVDIIHGFQALKSRDPRAFKYLMNGFDPRQMEKTHSGQKMLKRITSNYLAFKYGVQPTVLDLGGLMAFAKKPFETAPMICGKSNQRFTESIDVVVPIDFGYQRATYQQPVTVTVETDIKTSIYAHVDMDVDGFYHDINGLGLNLSSAAVLAWDLSPYSFILDMVMPMADIIRSQSAMQGLTGASATTTVFQKVTKTVPESASVAYSSPGYSFSGRNVKVNISGIGGYRMRRELVGTHGALPHFVNPIKVGNVATLVALFHTLTG